MQEAFVLGNDVNFIHAKITSERELFLSEVQRAILMNPI
jgi:hypothetical protein